RGRHAAGERRPARGERHAGRWGGRGRGRAAAAARPPRHQRDRAAARSPTRAVVRAAPGARRPARPGRRAEPPPWRGRGPHSRHTGSRASAPPPPPPPPARAAAAPGAGRAAPAAPRQPAGAGAPPPGGERARRPSGPSVALPPEVAAPLAELDRNPGSAKISEVLAELGRHAESALKRSRMEQVLRIIGAIVFAEQKVPEASAVRRQYAIALKRIYTK